MGNKYLAKLYQEGLMDKVMYICSIVGLMVIGSMIASMIGITTPIQMSEAFVLQDVLDNVMPQILPLGITFLMYWLLQKKSENRVDVSNLFDRWDRDESF